MYIFNFFFWMYRFVLLYKASFKPFGQGLDKEALWNKVLEKKSGLQRTTKNPLKDLQEGWVAKYGFINKLAEE